MKYSVKRLARRYCESYKHLPKKDCYKDLVDRGYDIIDEIEKDGVLFVGINPSYDENKPDLCKARVRKADGDDGYTYDSYFSRPRDLNSKIWEGPFSHVDLFSLRSKQQYKVRELVDDHDCSDFVQAQLGLFKEIIEGATPKVIIVINAFASDTILKYNALDELQYDNSLGVHLCKTGNRQIPVFLSGMLSGVHPLDKGSYNRLVWHIKYVLDNM